ncbi:GNAT family N-acetyltransferase [Alteromonas aestuariivivens]|uniref:GNAT family N-acetyltransferase n=1 Tax=Alteromonas aestuariivivens TaxID=1938339 RepID=A0A3D8M8M0_9ALTE|nr:GNAT family N-acetyltransferase [Alteromonas aestuariivivens]RDV26177.1 GNAT family N-acetyltransferase [Alteromonas aestuariivivens]
MAFQVENVDWMRGKNRLTQLRERVFVLEWRLPREAEFDEHDVSAFHVLISNEHNEPIATGRLTQDGEIGRIAVRRAYRSSHLYQMLFSALVGIAKFKGIAVVQVNCDLDSVDYHSKLGFTPAGPVFMEAGIPRQRMACPVTQFIVPDVLHMH